jgi:hypothetical protein
MAKRSCASAMLVAVLIALAGCGGDGESSATTDTAAGDDVRLTDAQWSEYESAKTSFVSARDAATTQLDQCPDTTADEFSTCIASTLDDLETAATGLGDFLSGLEGTVTGACASSAAALGSYTAPYANAVQVLQDAIDAGNAAEIPAAKSNLQTLTQGGTEETEAFEEACAPA